MSPLDRPMTLNDLEAELESMGWMISEVPKWRETHVDWYAWKRITEDAPECAYNEKKPGIALYPWRDEDHATRTGIEIELIAARRLGDAEQWWKLMAYEIPWHEVLSRLPALEAALTAAWRALHQDTPA